MSDIRSICPICNSYECGGHPAANTPDLPDPGWPYIESLRTVGWPEDRIPTVLEAALREKEAELRNTRARLDEAERLLREVQVHRQLDRGQDGGLQLYVEIGDFLESGKANPIDAPVEE